MRLFSKNHPEIKLDSKRLQEVSENTCFQVLQNVLTLLVCILISTIKNKYVAYRQVCCPLKKKNGQQIILSPIGG